MKKWIKRIAIAVVLLIVATLVIVYFALNGIIRSEVEKQATASLNVNTTLASANLAIFGGSLNLNDLEIASPPKFTAPHIFTLGGVSVAVHYSQLTGNPIHISKIVIDSPILVIEQANMKLNVQALMDQPSQPVPAGSTPAAQPSPPSQTTPPAQSAAPPAQPMKLIIDELDLNSAQVNFQPGLPGIANNMQVVVPSLTLKNIGNADGNENGAAIKEVVMQVITALAAKAESSGKLPLDLNSFLNTNLSSVTQSLGDEFKKQLSAVTGSGSTTAPSATGQQIEQGLENLLQKKK